MSSTRALAGFARDATVADLGPAVRVRVREHLKDCLGVALAAATEPPMAIINGLVGGRGAQPDGVYVLGADYRAAPWDAAWVNGTLCHLLDYDDYGFGHPTACVLPAALAAGELADASGPDLMLALAVGWDVFERLSRACRPHERTMRSKGIHPTAVYGGPAAAATAGKLLGLDAARLAVAMGLAASASTGLTEQFGTWGKGVQAGNSARAGVMGALLAERDYRAATTAIEGGHGLLSVFAGAGNYDLDALDAAGAGWAIHEPGVSIKRYPACGGTMRGIDAALALRDEGVGDPMDIVGVDVEASESMLHSLHVDRPRRGFEGKFCLRFCVAAALADGRVDIDSFSDESLERPIVQRLMDRTTVRVRPGGFVPGPEVYRMPVTVRLVDGTTMTREVAEPRGNTKNRMTYEEVTAKFVACARRLGTPSSVGRLNDAVDELESTSVRELVDAIAAVAR